MERNPLKVLNNAINAKVLIRLKDGTEYRGRLQKADTYMNMVVADATEFTNNSNDPIAKYGELFIRGNNVLFIKTDIE